MPRGDQRRSTVHAAVTQFRPCNKHVNPVNSDKPKQKVKQTTTANQWHTVTIWFTLSLKNVINGYSWIFILTCFIPYHVAKHSDSADDDVRHFQWRKFFCWSQASYLKGKKGDISFQECLGIPVYSTKSLNDPISVHWWPDCTCILSSRLIKRTMFALPGCAQCSDRHDAPLFLILYNTEW